MDPHDILTDYIGPMSKYFVEESVEYYMPDVYALRTRGTKPHIWVFYHPNDKLGHYIKVRYNQVVVLSVDLYDPEGHSKVRTLVESIFRPHHTHQVLKMDPKNPIFEITSETLSDLKQDGLVIVYDELRS